MQILACIGESVITEKTLTHFTELPVRYRAAGCRPAGHAPGESV